MARSKGTPTGTPTNHHSIEQRLNLEMLSDPNHLGNYFQQSILSLETFSHQDLKIDRAGDRIGNIDCY